MPFFRRQFPRFLLPVALAALGAIVCTFMVPAEAAAVRQHMVGFPDSDEQAHLLRPVIVAALCFLPALAAALYACGRTMDRYIARQFGTIFGVCLLSLLVIWLLIDLSDNLPDFRNSGHALTTALDFYSTRAPAVFLLLLPYSLLLALLYSLGKLSGSREIIAMIQSGRGVPRIALPLVIAGLFFSLASAGLNYHWGPTAEGAVDAILARATGKEVTKASNVLYRNPHDRRLWMIGAFPPDYQIGTPLLNIEVTTTREDNSLATRISAKKAYWDRQSHDWTFEDAVIGTFAPGEPATFQTLAKPYRVQGWSETPWQLIKPGLSAAFLGVPDLDSWLQFNRKLNGSMESNAYLTQWHYRWALPFTCLVTVLLATPLAVHFSRRGAGGGVFLAVALSAVLLLITNISLALGESGTLSPFLAAWLPNIGFSLLGFYLFQRRITGRPIYQSLRHLIPGSD